MFICVYFWWTVCLFKCLFSYGFICFSSCESLWNLCVILGYTNKFKIYILCVHRHNFWFGNWTVLTFAHKLSNNVYGLLRHHGIERYQFVMPQFLHDLSLLQESLWRHGARLQGLDRHLSRTVPCAWIYMKQNVNDHLFTLYLSSKVFTFAEEIHFQFIKRLKGPFSNPFTWLKSQS